MTTTKRLVDIAVSTTGLVVLSPLLLIIAGAVWMLQGRPVLFRQSRPGLRGRPFTLLKFRTMTTATGAKGEPLPDAARLTPLGRLLRSWSLDELPELVNVVKGDMSLVGPRPLLPQYLERYSITQARRHEVKPGLTGWAQVRGRNALNWAEKLDLDVWYVDHRSWWLDLKIILLTLPAVLRRDGISEAGHATASEFKGSGS